MHDPWDARRSIGRLPKACKAGVLTSKVARSTAQRVSGVILRTSPVGGSRKSGGNRGIDPSVTMAGMDSSRVRVRLGDGDGQLAARAGGEGRERLVDPVQRVGLPDRRLHAAGGDLVGEPGKRGGVRVGEHARDARVRQGELVGGRDRRRQPAAPALLYALFTVRRGRGVLGTSVGGSSQYAPFLAPRR